MTMIEKAAMTAYTRNPSVERGRNILGYLEWHELGLWQKRGFVDGMRAALTAIRNEATREAAELGQFFGGLDCSGYYEEAADHVWTAIIDSILKEGT